MSSPRPLEPFAVRTYRTVLRMYPTEYRRQYAAQMAETFAQRLAELRPSGPSVRMIGFLVREILGVVASAAWIFLTARRQPPATTRHRARPLRFGESLRQDLRYAWRGLIRNPGFTGIAVITLALGIGANTAIFSLVRGVVFRPLPYEAPHELVRVWHTRTFNKFMVDFFAREAQSFTGVSAFSGWGFTLTGEGEPRELNGAKVSHNHFGLLGVKPLWGRTFAPEDRLDGRSDVAILSFGLWQRQFGADTSVLGRTIALSGEGSPTRTVIGIMPPGYRPLIREWELWIPLSVGPTAPEADDSWYLGLIGRRRPGISTAAAAAEVKALGGRLHATYRHLRDEELATADAVPLKDFIVGAEIRTALLVVLGAVALVLVVACSNVANLLLVRASAREREFAIRSALGAGRRRVVRQLLTESALLGVAGGSSGLGLAFLAVTALRHRLPTDIPRTDEVSVDLPVLVFASLASLAATVFFGTLPAIRSSRLRLRDSLTTGGGGPGVRGQRVNHGLVVAEIAMAMMLVVGSALMLKSLWRLYHVAPGFDLSRVLAVKVITPATAYRTGPDVRDYYRRVTERVAAIEGVDAVGGIHLLPMTTGNWTFPFAADDHPIPDGDPPLQASYRVVLPGYFGSMGIPVLRGRAFNEQDRSCGLDRERCPPGAAGVVVINRALGRQLWPAGDGIGKSIRLFSSASYTYQVVGIVGDVRQHTLAAEPRAEMYYPLAQRTLGRMFLTIRTRGDPAGLAGTVRAVVRSVDADVPISLVSPVHSIVRESVSDARFTTLLLSLFGALALTLGALGVYGVTSYAVSQRTREIGVRLALGAQPVSVVRSALLRGMAPVAAGVAVGTIGALAAARVMSGLLYDVSATDPLTLGSVALALSAIALLACYLPAVRAARVPPRTALRAD